MPFENSGLLDLEAIKKVLAAEDTPDLYRAMRKAFRTDEPELAKNLEYWIIRELEEMNQRFGPMEERVRDWMGHLIERYCIRGFQLHKEAVNRDLEQQFGDS